MVGHADENELARAGRLPATIGRNRGQIQRPRDRLDAHRAPLERHAISPSAAQPLAVAACDLGDRKGRLGASYDADLLDAGVWALLGGLRPGVTVTRSPALVLI
jgi:hypothetical protein